MRRPAPAPAGSRGGFALLIALIMLILGMSMAAAVISANVGTERERDRVKRAQGFLDGLSVTGTGIARFQTDTKRLPKALSQLANAITPADVDICDRSYTNAAINEWGARYVDHVPPPGGSPVGIGVARDTLEYQSVDGQSGFVIVVVPQVPEGAALLLDARVDTVAGMGSAAGTVRWTTPPAGDGTVVLRWFMLFPKC